MQTILSDHNCEGQAEDIFNALRHRGFFPLLPMTLVQFRDVGLHISADDLKVWQFCQENNYLLLTGNRSASAGVKSLEYVVHHYLTENTLPVITIGNLGRVSANAAYCWQCAENLVEIALDLDKVRGTPRLYIPGHAVRR